MSIMAILSISRVEIDFKGQYSVVEKPTTLIQGIRIFRRWIVLSHGALAAQMLVIPSTLETLMIC